MARDVPDVASWNPYWKNTTANIKKGIAALVDAGADVVCLQEMSDDTLWNETAAHMKPLGWWVTPKSNAIPIYVNTKTYEVVDWKSTLYDNSDRPVEPGAGGDTAPTKSIMRVSIRHRVDGTVSHHFNLHLIATIERDGQVGGGYNPLRLAFAQGHIDLLKKLAKTYVESGDPVTVSADWNVSSSTAAGAWLRNQLAEFTSAQDNLGPFNTQGVREIDDIYYANCHATKFRRLEDFGSDHAPIEVDFTGPKDDDTIEEPPVAWRLAPTIVQLRREVNAEWPLRDKTSDGTLGNASHAASRSDHNPDNRGVVCAMDFDEDLQGSATRNYPRFNPGQAARGSVDRLLSLAKAGMLPQLYYVIYESRIYSRTTRFASRPYSGANAHDHHVHVSVYHDPKLADRTTAWGIGKPDPVVEQGPKISLARLKAGIADPSETSPEVKMVQIRLNEWRGSLDLDEDGYWGVRTERGYATYQAWRYGVPVGHEDADGIPGVESLRSLGFWVIP